MKKQLIVLSALFVGFASQCSFYERMKAKAASAAQSVKDTATSAYDKYGGMAQSAKGKLSDVATSAQDKFGGMAQSASGRLQSAAGSVRDTIGQESKAFMSGARSVPSQVSEIKENIEDKLSEWGYKARKKVESLSPKLDKVTVTNVETGEELVEYVNR